MGVMEDWVGGILSFMAFLREQRAKVRTPKRIIEKHKL